MICVGGATFGGAGKTPVAIALAQELAQSGASVAFVGHGHKGRLVGPMRVTKEHPVAQVGDEAWLAADALAPFGVPVFVAPQRADAISEAAQARAVLVVDGVLQTHGVRAGLSVLLLPGAHELTHARVFPFGDLRAAPARLRALADVSLTRDDVAFELSVRNAQGQDASLSELRGARVGLFTAVGRPARVLQMLQAQGVQPVVHVRFADHGPVTARPLLRAQTSDGVDVWLCTDKCAAHLHQPILRPWVLSVRARIPRDLTDLALALASRLPNALHGVT